MSKIIKHSQDFFPRSSQKKGTGFIFNKAPLNKREAKEETQEKVRSGKQKRSAFIAKLYDDEFDQDMKVFNMPEQDDTPQLDSNKRKKKESHKIKSKFETSSSSTKIPKLKFQAGTLGLFAIKEIHETYAIVNYTRNVKGFIALENQEDLVEKLEVGQLIIAGMVQQGSVDYNQSTSGNLNKKLQLVVDPQVINKYLTIEHINYNTVLQGIVHSKEGKGYLIDFGMKDKSKGFLSSNFQDISIGQLILVLTKNTLPSSKIIKCELLNQENSKNCIATKVELTFNQMKPGYLVNCKVTEVLENGLEVSFLGGFTGTIFADHIDKDSINSYKLGEKLVARLIQVDIPTKKIQLSLLPHIVKAQNIAQTLQQSGVTVGSLFTNVKVEKVLYGQSFQVSLKDDIKGFLHKIHTKPQNEEEVKEEEQDPDKKSKKSKQKKKKVNQELDEGSVIEKIKVKEINYFDGVPILSMRDDILGSATLDYHSLEIGQFLNATIEEVNDQLKCIFLRVNDFVKGKLFMEHMSDYPVKMIPPKFRQTGKDIKVRVFNVDPEERELEFTKKETLMNQKTPVFKSYKEVKKGQKLIGIAVGENEYGIIVKYFGGIKGLLTFSDIKAHAKHKDFKTGSIVKAYVLFKKKDQGMALTLDKRKAKELRKNSTVSSTDHQNKSFEDFLPTQDELVTLKDKYKILLKSQANINNVMEFRVIEHSVGRYFIVKSLNALKKSQNFIAILPSCLVQKQHQIQMMTEKSFQGLILDQHEGISLITSNLQLINFKDQIPSDAKAFENQSSTFVGYISSVSNKGIQLRFFNQLKKLVLIKDLDHPNLAQTQYQIGQPIRCGLNTKDRISLKHRVIYKKDLELFKNDKQIQIESYYQILQQNLSRYPKDLMLGAKVEGTIQLIKDYGMILKLDNQSEMTGFLLNDNKLEKDHKEGQKIQCKVLDIDFEKNIVDLSEKLNMFHKKSKNLVQLGKQKVVIELNKEEHVVFSCKSNRDTIGICMMQNFNNDSEVNLNEKCVIGEELEVDVIQILESGIVLGIPVVNKNEVKGERKKGGDLVEGLLVNATVKSKKGYQAYLQLPLQSQMVIGRLHALECQSLQEFEDLAINSQVQTKILKISEGKYNIQLCIDKKKTWVELTRKKQHLLQNQGLSKEALAQTLQSYEDLKDGQIYKGLITEINYNYSSPVNFCLSSFVKGQIQFNRLFTNEDLIKGTEQYKLNKAQLVDIHYSQENFYLQKPQEIKKIQKGCLVQVRYVKKVPGKGITVQLDEATFGFIEICELTDEILGDICKSFQEKHIFLARIIDTDKTGKFVLSARNAVIDEKYYQVIGPEGKSLHFQKKDEKYQKQGNQRNKILKFGANISLHEGDLCQGYIVNIGKSGCFIQIGHQCTVRAALTELSDKSSFDYQSEMPLERQVLGRITKVDEKTGTKRFDFSLRKSLVVFGSNALDRSEIQEQGIVDVIILQIVNDKAFGSIKGTYNKLKIKHFNKNAFEIGDIVKVQLTKVTKQKISGDFLEKSQDQGLNQDQKLIEQIFESIEEEAQKDIQRQLNTTQQMEIDEEQLKRKREVSEDEIEVQMEELKQLQDQDQDSAMEEDSDKEEIQRIIKESKTYDSDESMNEEDESEQEENDKESEEQEDEQMQGEESEEEEEEKKHKSGKKALKQRIQEEHEIRKKENQMRENSDKPTSIDDFERLLVANQDQSYIWIQYMAFMIDKLGLESARRVAEKAVKSVSISNESDKFNLWVAYMNLENNFGTQQSLEQVVKRALEVNDRKKIYLQLIQIYQGSHKYQYIEDIYRVLSKKFNTSLKVWGNYLEFLFEMRHLKESKDAQHRFLVADLEFSEPKPVLQRALQSLPEGKHVNVISKFGMLEFKFGSPENGRTMFEGIVNNYPKRMDIWAIYMDMEVKYGGKNNSQQAIHLFERCLSNKFIQKKPKKMKLVFQKYMEYELAQGNKKNVEKLRERVEQYLEKAFKPQTQEESD